MMDSSSRGKLLDTKTSTSLGLASTIPTNLPAQPTGLVGRYQELVLLRGLLLRDDLKLVTITGFGGAGKTTLSLGVAALVLEHFPSGVFFIDLEQLNDSSQLLPALFQTLKLREEQNNSLLETLNDFLGERAVLLVMDNFEHLLDGVSLVGQLLDKHPHLKVFATSREPLKLRREQVFPLEPLPNHEAVELFKQRARALNPNLSLSHEDTSAISAICEQLDGLPLAIELAAQRTTIFTPQALMARLQNLTSGLPDPSKPDSKLLNLLASKNRDLPVRHQTLRETIAWSYGLLSHVEQHVSRVASLFQGGCSLGALEAVTGEDEALLLEAVSSLVDKNLLKTVQSTLNESRFTMLNTIREFAWSEALRFEDMEKLLSRYLDYYLTLARDAELGLRGKDQVRWLDHLDVENINIQTAFTWSFAAEIGSDNWNKGFQTICHLQRYWMLRGHFATGNQWIERVRASVDAEAARYDDSKIPAFVLERKAKVYGLGGMIHWIVGRYHKADEFLQASLEAQQALGDERSIGDAFNSVAVNLEYIGKFEKAVEYYRQALQTSIKLGDRWQEMRVRFNIGNASAGLGDFETGRSQFQASMELARALGDEYFVAAYWQGFGYLEFRQGQIDNAIDSIRKSIAMYEKMDVPYMYLWALVSLTRVLSVTEQHEAAAKTLLQSIQLSEYQRDRNMYRTLLEALIAFCLSLKKHEHSARFLGCLEANFSGENEVIALVDRVIFENMVNDLRSKFTNKEMFIRAKRRGAEMNMRAAFDLAAEICLEVSENRTPTRLPDHPFTERERDVLSLLVKGKSNEEIAHELVVVEKTVEKHVANILRKLGLRNRTEAAAWGINHGIVDDKKEK